MLKPEEQAEYNKRSSLLFFNPTKDKNDYITHFYHCYPEKKSYAYSPLYELRSQIKNFDKDDNWFAAVIFAGITIEGLVSNITSDVQYNKVRDEDFIGFFNNYLGLTKSEWLVSRQLRNAREHNFGQILTTINKKDDKKVFDLICMESFTQGIFNDSDADLKNAQHIKLTFSLSVGYSFVAQFDHMIVRSDYALVEARMNPKKYIDALEIGITKLEYDCQCNEHYQRRILANLKEDNWMHIY